MGPHVDPKNIDYLEVLRGSYAADWGDRTYGIFNVAPRTGFERNQEAELVASFGNFNQTNDELSFGSHTSRFAYLASVNGNRSDLGLETPTSAVIHDRESGVGGFGSLIFNVRPADQLRLVTSLRRDFYQVPNDPDAQAAGMRDVERESDAFVDFTWVHTLRSGLLLTLFDEWFCWRLKFGSLGPSIISTAHTLLEGPTIRTSTSSRTIHQIMVEDRLF